MDQNEAPAFGENHRKQQLPGILRKPRLFPTLPYSPNVTVHLHRFLLEVSRE
jgi:hypothetical protein